MSTFRSHRMWWVVAGIALLLILAWAFHATTGSARAAEKPKTATPPPVQVTTAVAQSQDVPIYRTGIGTVTATASVTVKTRVDGQLVRVGFTEGQDVKQGQLIAQIDPRTYEAQLAQVQAQKARDMALLGNARADLKRYTTLIGEDAATQQQVDTQKALVAQLEAAVQTDAAAVQYAQVQLGFTSIAAPISGRVGARLVDPGNIVHAADTNGLVIINKIDPITVLFTLPEENFQDINRALHTSTSPLQVVAYPRNGSEPIGFGQLILLNNQIDTTTGTVQMKGSFANAAHALWPGQYVNVRLVLRHEPHAITVPATAVQRSQDGTFVWVVGNAGTAVNQAVRLGPIQDGIAVIETGLQAGQRVVVDGQYKLKPGIAVTDVPRGAGRGASGATRSASGPGTSTGTASSLAGASASGT